jgi:hypothetical protein
MSKEDIESLGFLLGPDLEDHYYKDGYEIAHHDESGFTQISTNTPFYRLIFEGTISTKSELIVLLKQLGIDER